MAPPTTALGRLSLAPSSIAVVGATVDADKLAGRTLRYLRQHGFAGPVYAVNPRYTEVAGFPCYATIGELPEPVDLAFIVTAAKHVPGCVREAGERGIPWAIVVAAGFAEAGDGAFNRELEDAIRDTGIRVSGPNCLGLISPARALYATVSTVLQRTPLQPGGVGIVAQSGGMSNWILESLQSAGIGVSTCISTGNEIDLGFGDYATALLEDPDTRLVAGYVEGFKGGEDLVTLGRQAHAAGKPLILLKVGRSAAGRRMAQSHTGKMLGNPRATTQILRQAGIVAVDDLDELLDTVTLLVRAPRLQPPGLAVISPSGGLNVMLTDAAQQAGLELRPLGDTTGERLRAIVPSFVSVANPLDLPIAGQDDLYAESCRAILDDPSVHTVLLCLSSFSQNYETVVPLVVDLARHAAGQGKQLAVTWVSALDRLPGDGSQLEAAGVVAFESPLRALRAIRHLNQVADWQKRSAESATRPPVTPRTPGSRPAPADYVATRELLTGYGVPLVAGEIAGSASEAAAIAERTGYPVALKVEAADIAHKTEVGGVRLGINGERDLRRAVEEIVATMAARHPGLEATRILVQPMVGSGLEIIAGISHDPEFGPVLTLGAGGILTELLDDASYRALPVDPEEIREMCDETRISQLLAGYRSGPPHDVDALVESVTALVDAYANEPWILDLEANPIIVGPKGQGAAVVDILLGTGSTGEADR